MKKRHVTAGLVSLGLATAIHLDWHFARPAHHQLSLGLPYHWLLAVPVFALTAWYVGRAWADTVGIASFAVLGSGFLIGGVVEPALEYFLAGATLEWAFGAARNETLAIFMLTGLLAYGATLFILLRGRATGGGFTVGDPG